ncbi:MAG: hypothetical protein ACHQ7M_23725, partial [Chloroflexota bacterium]
MIGTKEYTPLDLSTLCNAGPEIVPEQEQVLIGAHSVHGIPLQIGPTAQGSRACFLRLAGGDPSVAIDL